MISRSSGGEAVKNHGQNLRRNPTVSPRETCVRTCSIVYTIPYIRRKHGSLTISVHDLESIENTRSVSYSAFPISSIQRDRHRTTEINREQFTTTNSNMFLKRVCLISVILAVASAAPSRLFKRVPMWYLPCGQFEYEDVNSLEESEEEISTRLDRIKVQYRLTLDNYLEQNYGSLYKKVRIGVLDHQYIPNWVPGRADVNTVRKLNDSGLQTVSAGTQLTLLHVYFVHVSKTAT